MKMKLAFAAMSALVGLVIYLFAFKTFDDEYILSYGWKGGGCGLPDVLDFRGGAITLDENNLYINNRLLGRIVKRTYRPHADSYLDIQSEAGETCRYWGKWPR